MITMKFMKTMNACLVLADNLEVTPLYPVAELYPVVVIGKLGPSQSHPI